MDRQTSFLNDGRSDRESVAEAPAVPPPKQAKVKKVRFLEEIGVRYYTPEDSTETEATEKDSPFEIEKYMEQLRLRETGAPDSVDQEPLKFAVARAVKKSRDVGNYRVLRLISPFHFSLIEEQDIDQCFTLSGGFKLLQELALNLQLHLKIWRPRTLTRNKMYVIFDQRSQQWHRCRLISFNEETGKGEVFYFDYYLELETAALKDLREIPNEITQYPVVPQYRCHLYDITPRDGSHVWSNHAIDLFENLVWKQDGKLLMGVQMSWKEKLVGGFEGADRLVDVGMILFENVYGEVFDDASVNWKLVKFGHAQAIGVGGCHYSSLFFNDAEPRFSFKGAPHLPLPEWFLKPFPHAAGSRLPQVGITSVLGPDCIYVSLVSKHADYKALTHFIRTKMDPTQKLTKEQLKVGLPVLCMEHLQESDGVTQRRSRGVVLKVFDENAASVLQVDTGKMIKVSLEDLYLMPEELIIVPAFVHRIHLQNIRPKRERHVLMIKWFPEARLQLSHVLQSLVNPACFVVRSSPTTNQDIVTLNEIHQPLAFYAPEEKWKTVDTGREHHLGLRNLPMLQSYFYSFGADLHIVSSPEESEAAANNNGEDGKDALWNFQSLSALLVETKVFDAELGKMEGVDKEKYYKTLLDSHNV